MRDILKFLQIMQIETIFICALISSPSPKLEQLPLIVYLPYLRSTFKRVHSMLRNFDPYFASID